MMERAQNADDNSITLFDSEGGIEGDPGSSQFSSVTKVKLSSFDASQRHGVRRSLCNRYI